jgi:taurine dioxygenase
MLGARRRSTSDTDCKEQPLVQISTIRPSKGRLRVANGEQVVTFAMPLAMGRGEHEGPIGGELTFQHPLSRAKDEYRHLVRALHQSGGLLLLQGLADLSPPDLVAISRIFGRRVEDYRDLVPEQLIHPAAPEVFVVSNAPPAERRPPDRPIPALTPDGTLPTTFPHRRGWHVDQSFRAAPPDVSLLYGVVIPDADQGQTLVADSARAYTELPTEVQNSIAHLDGIHVRWGTGRTGDESLSGLPVLPARGVETPRRQPVVRVHPASGSPAIYLCDQDQMDCVDGPIYGMEPGMNGDGARLLSRLISHITMPEFVYTHRWRPGDLLVLDNRCVLHAATWFDAERYQRTLWRTTVAGAYSSTDAGLLA